MHSDLSSEEDLYPEMVKEDDYLEVVILQADELKKNHQAVNLDPKRNSPFICISYGFHIDDSLSIHSLGIPAFRRCSAKN